MLSIKPLSDLHFEFDLDRGDKFIKNLSNDCDILVLAGDIVCPYHTDYEPLKKLCDKFKTVLYVAGNHEFYKSSFAEEMKKIKKLNKEIPNLHFLNNKRIEIEGQGFGGTTLWFPETGWVNQLKGSFSDFRFIEDNYKIFKEHSKAINFIEKKMKKDDILITHHVTTSKAIHPMFEGNIYNDFFITDISKLLEKKKIKMSIFGHSHIGSNFVDNNIRYVCNPKGYFMERYITNFNPNLIIEV